MPLFWGCGSGTPEASGAASVTVRDSAGIEIVEVPRSILDSLPRWAFAPEPELEIGVVEGQEEYQFSRIGGVRTLSDGSVVVANRTPIAIRYYDPDGAFVREVGREGEGPGEYGYLRSIEVIPGDSVVAWDPGLSRITVLDPEGRLARTTRVEPAWQLDWYIGSLRDGAPVFAIDGSSDSVRVQAVVAVAPDGAAMDTVHAHPIELRLVVADGDVRWMAPVFTPFQTAAGASAERIWWTPGGPFEVLGLGPDGSVQRILRFALPRTEVTDEFFDWWVDTTVARYAERSKALVREGMHAQGATDSLPSVDRLRVASDGRLWLRRFQLFQPYWLREGDDWEWLVVDPESGPVAWVSMPRAFDDRELNREFVVGFGPDFVVGVHWDELGVEYVRRYPLVDAGTGEPVREGG